jgi:hypothetical protein
LSKGEQPGPENSIGKLVAASTMQEIAMFALDLQGQAGILDGPEAADSARFQAMLMRSVGTRIEGGTDEILRNIIAERVLGLPPDIRADKGTPFNQIPTGRRVPPARAPSDRPTARRAGRKVCAAVSCRPKHRCLHRCPLTRSGAPLQDGTKGGIRPSLSPAATKSSQAPNTTGF